MCLDLEMTLSLLPGRSSILVYFNTPDSGSSAGNLMSSTMDGVSSSWETGVVVVVVVLLWLVSLLLVACSRGPVPQGDSYGWLLQAREVFA